MIMRYFLRKEYLDQSRIKKTPWIWGTQHCLHAYPLCSSCVWLEYRGATPAHVVILAPGLQPASTHTRTRHPRNAAHAQYLLAGNEPPRSLTIMEKAPTRAYGSVLKSKFVQQMTHEDGHYGENPSNHKLLTVRGGDCRASKKMFRGLLPP